MNPSFNNLKSNLANGMHNLVQCSVILQNVVMFNVCLCYYHAIIRKTDWTRVVFVLAKVKYLQQSF